jgi:hypothetical protein
MAIVNTGNPLTTALLQPGWTVVADGFGLNTSTTVYKIDTTFDIDAFVVKGSPHPDAAYSYLKLDKWKVSWDSLDIATLTVDYVGIDTAVNAGEYTAANTSSANGLTTENLTAHPNFKALASGFTTGPIAGAPGSYTQSDLGPLVEIKDPADYVTQVIAGKTIIISKKQSYIGANGACFESELGGRLIGFVDPTYANFYGKTNYLATTTTYSGVIYMKEAAYVIDILGYLNAATATTDFGTWTLIPDWAVVGVGSGGGNSNLLSQVNVEEFGSLYKVMYEIRYSKVGWDSSVYINI